MKFRSTRARILLRSRPLSLFVAAAALWSTVSVVQRAEATRQMWGERRTVVRAARDLQVGERITADDLRLIELPKGVAGIGTTSRISSLVGRRVVSLVHAGDLIVAPRTRHVLSAVAARISPGHRGVSIPADERLPNLRVGDLVSIVDPTQPAMAAIDASVIDTNDESITVDAAQDDAVLIANAVLRDSVAILLRGPNA